jgi:hypothetical protein
MATRRRLDNDAPVTAMLRICGVRKRWRDNRCAHQPLAPPPQRATLRLVAHIGSPSPIAGCIADFLVRPQSSPRGMRISCTLYGPHEATGVMARARSPTCALHSVVAPHHPLTLRPAQRVAPRRPPDRLGYTRFPGPVSPTSPVKRSQLRAYGQR